MKIKNTKRSIRVSLKKVTICNFFRGLTSQADLDPVVKFLRKSRMLGLTKDTVDHKLGPNILFDSVDAVFLTVMPYYKVEFELRSV